MKSLYKTCAGHASLPRSLYFELDGDPVGFPMYSGGFGDVWKCEYRDREVAVKILRPRGHDGSQDIGSVSH